MTWKISPQAAAKELLRRRKSRNSLIEFTEYTFDRYKTAGHHRIIADQLERVERGEIDRLMLMLPPRHGKLCADSTPVPTPAGWTNHGDLGVGDKIFGANGEIIEVTAVSPPSFATHEVRFTDGSSVKVHLNHEWTVYDRGRQVWKTVETRYLASRKILSGNRAVFQLPLRPALQYPEAKLPMPPYALGAWLGDGSASKPCITHDAMIGVMNNKHIPDAYKYSSVKQRLMLLAGLIDTDGHVCKTTGRVRIATCSARLAQDTSEIVRSLGWHANLYEQQPMLSTSGIQGKQVVFYVGFNPSMDIPTRIPRKMIRRPVGPRRVGIAEVKECIPEIGRCIQVSSRDGLYVVGNELIVTHNSELASKRFPAFAMGRRPERQFISVSATAELANDFGRDVRNIISSPEYRCIFPGTSLADDSSARGKWHTSNGGIYYSIGVGGAVLGRGGDTVLIDDPFSSMQDAQSELGRKRIWDWYTGTLYNRLMPGGSIVIINHRMHEDDLVGRLLAQQAAGGDIWHVVELGIDDYCTPLWPEAYPKEALERIRANTTPQAWAALYQQKPSPDEGDYFKREWFKWYDSPPKHLRIYGASDYAVTAKGGDYTVHIVAGIDPDDNLYILDMWREQTESDVWIEVLLDLIQEYKPLKWAEEAGQIIKSLGPFINKRQRERRIYCQREQYASVSDKPTRARSFQARASMGKVFLPARAAWINTFMHELLTFPVGKTDDIIDPLGLLGRMLDDMHPASGERPKTGRRDGWDDVFGSDRGSGDYRAGL